MRTLWHAARLAVSLPLKTKAQLLSVGLLALAGGARAQDFQLDWQNDGKGTVFSFYHPTALPFSAEKPASLKKAPAGLKAPLYGELKLGPAESPTISAVVLDEPENGPARLWVDTNGNGDLTDDSPAEWDGRPDGQSGMRYSGGFVVNVRLGTQSVPMPYKAYRFARKDPARNPTTSTFYFYRNFARTGKITLGAKTYQVWVSDESNLVNFNCPADSKRKDMLLAIDLNGNGRVDHETERFKVGEPFNVGGAGYVVTSPDAAGAVLHLERATVPVPEVKPPAATSAAASQAKSPAFSGEKAQSFSARTMAGRNVNFPLGYKGKIVMLDFWATWCGPCRAEMPHVADAYNQFSSKGFEVLGVSLDSTKSPDEVQSFTQDSGMKWEQVYEGGGWKTRLATLYNVHSIPKALLVDGDTGVIIASGNELRGSSLARVVEKALQTKNGK